jgi:hypothetical protein
VGKEKNLSSVINAKFIWTEAFNCGELLQPFLNSFLKHHQSEINVYGFRSDLDKIKFEHPQVILHDLDGIFFNKKPLSLLLEDSFKFGHLGTAILWSWLIKTRSETNFIHLDADTIFLGNVIEDFEAAISLGYKIVGTRRPYRYRSYRKQGIDGWLLDKRKDTLNTDCFYFDTNKVRKIPFSLLVRMIQGRRIGILPVVDFFDPIIFRLLKKKQKILYIDSQNAGFNSQSNPNSEFHEKRISFAAVGSGINFYKNPEVVTSPGYRGFALASYSLYSATILGLELPIEPLNDVNLKNKLEKLDKEKWDLSK